VLFEAALDLQIESAAAADEEVDALDREVEADTQSILRLVRSARARDLGDAAVSSPFPRWEQTRRRLARWAGGDEGEGALSPAEEPVRSARPGVSSS
jgi:hypothetical protein